MPLPAQYHDRFEPADYEAVFEECPLEERPIKSVCSPMDACSQLKWRALYPEEGIERIPTDILIWGRGKPKHPCATMIGGIPVWPPDLPMPCNHQELQFFGQFNFLDSLDLLPKLPTGLLSIWGTPDFPWSPEESIRAYWIDPERAKPVRPFAELNLELLPENPFYAALFRTWDPAPGQDIAPVKIESSYYSEFTLAAWEATKFGGVAQLPQDHGQAAYSENVFMQFCSIQPAWDVSFPWLNREESLDLHGNRSSVHHKENSLMLADLGSISLTLRSDGRVVGDFACY